MNIPTTVEAVAVIAILFIPGYIFLQFTKSAVAFVPQGADARYFFAVLTWGGLIHLSFYWWTRRLLDWYLSNELDQHDRELALWALIVLVATPLFAGLGGSWLIKKPLVDKALERIGMDYVSRTPSAWNYSTKLGPRWVRVHLKDGTIVGGTFGLGAFADDTGEQDIYLDQVYNLDAAGDFGEVVLHSAGVWIAHDEISHVMFYDRSDKEVGHD